MEPWTSAPMTLQSDIDNSGAISPGSPSVLERHLAARCGDYWRW
jgi:hypothetical protein